MWKRQKSDTKRWPTPGTETRKRRKAGNELACEAKNRIGLSHDGEPFTSSSANVARGISNLSVLCIGCVAYGKEEEPAEKERKEELRLGEFVWFSTSSCVALCLSSVEAKIDAEANANVPVRRGV